MYLMYRSTMADLKWRIVVSLELVVLCSFSRYKQEIRAVCIWVGTLQEYFQQCFPIEMVVGGKMLLYFARVLSSHDDFQDIATEHESLMCFFLNARRCSYLPMQFTRSLSRRIQMHSAD